ncbi:MAG TPA: cytochrome P460 family protein [Chryseolinea sp.]
MKISIYLILAGLTFLPMISCVYHELDPPSSSAFTDASIFEEINEAGFEYYQGGTLLSPASASPHGNFKLRFNEEALSSLDATGELPDGGVFMNGSVIVKEVYVNNALTVLAVMKKTPSDVNAANGWLWAEYKPDGGVFISIAAKGNSCTSCHDDLPNRDFVRTFDFH